MGSDSASRGEGRLDAEQVTRLGVPLDGATARAARVVLRRTVRMSPDVCNAGLARDMNAVMTAEARFRALTETTYASVARYVRHRGLSGQDAEDLVAATYEVAWRRLDVLPTGDGALPWLFAVALNHVRNHRRKRLREQALLDRLAAPELAAQPSDPTSIGWRHIREALDTLGSDDRELVLLVAWDGLSPAQAGAVLGLTPVASRSRVHRVRAKLAEILDGGQSRPSPGREPGENTTVGRSGA